MLAANSQQRKGHWRRGPRRKCSVNLNAARLSLVFPFTDFLDYFGTKRRQVVGVAARDQPLVADDIFVFP